MRNPFKLLSLAIITLLLLSGVHNGSAQVKKKKTVRSLRDSLRQSVLQRNSMIRSFKHSANASLDNLLGKIEDYSAQYIQTNSDLSRGFDTLEISQRLPVLEKRLGVMKSTIDNSGTLGYLVTIRNMVDHVMDQTDSWEKQLTKYSTQLDNIHNTIVSFKTDSVLHTAPEDSTLQDKYVDQVVELTAKWEKLDSCAKKSIIRIGQLQNRISAISIIMIDLNDRVDVKIHQFTVKSVDNEYGFIWNPHPQKFSADTAIARSYNLNCRLYKYFFTSKSNYWPHLGCIILLLAFFAWIFNSKRKLNRVMGADAETIFSQTHFVVRHPYVSTLAVTSLLAPFFYDHPPLTFVRTVLLVLTLCIGVLIHNVWGKPLFNFWKVLLGLCIVFSISDLFILVTYADRVILLIASAMGIYASLRFIKQHKVNPDAYPPYIELILKLFIALQGTSIVLNITGRFSLAKIVGSAAVFNLCLAMGMYLLVQILMESLFLQLEANKSADGENVTSYIDFKLLQKKFKDVVIKVAAVLWLVALAKNLDIDDFIYDQANQFLTHSYEFGTKGGKDGGTAVAFTFGSILTFAIILWLSGLLARVISFFYDFAGQHTRLSPHAKKTRSSILLIRLTIFVIGFFVAVTAAGIPMTQVTIVIGALGVGIGFGLQNIVNNLVSGIILAFEKPVQVGDIIEVSGKSGTITEIGIRSSKIDCGNGSELIVPNGDLISQHVVNWTLTNNNRQVDMTISVAYGSDVNKVNELLKTIITSQEEVIASPAPNVYLNNFGESAIDFKVQFWADITRWTSLKSSVMNQIYVQFASAGIEIPHPKKDIQVYFPGSNPANTAAPVTPPEPPLAISAEPPVTPLTNIPPPTKNPEDQDH